MASVLTVALARPSSARQQPSPQHSRPQVAARALSLPMQQPTPAGFSGGYSSEAASCPWPQPADWQQHAAKSHAPAASRGGIWASLTGHQVRRGLECAAHARMGGAAAAGAPSPLPLPPARLPPSSHVL